MNILITGNLGLLGSHLDRYLANKGHKIVGIDNQSGGLISNYDPRVIQYSLNLEDDAQAINYVFNTHKIDYVYHFAAYAAEGLSPFIRSFNYKNNLIASTNIINACVNYKVKKLIFASSMAVYGHNQTPFREDMRPEPDDPYGVAKYAVEMDIALAHKMFGLNYTIIRPHNIIGCGQNIYDRYRNVIGIWIRRALNGDTITIYGDGSQVRAFSDIDFYMYPFERLMTDKITDGQIYNIGADKYYTILEAAQILQKSIKKFAKLPVPEIEYLAKRNEVHTAYCNHDKAKKDLGFIDNTNLEKTMNDMLSWAYDNTRNYPVRLMHPHYEIVDGMYDYWKK